LKNQIGPESGTARFRIPSAAGGGIVRMGRLIEPVSNGRARLMIEITPVKTGMKQNPAYRFAAVK
jgi:hypothetical protein